MKEYRRMARLSGALTAFLIRVSFLQLPQNDFTVIKTGDIKIIETLKAQQFEMQVKDDTVAFEMQETNPFRVRIAQRRNALKAVKVVRTVHTAEIAGRGSEKFTVVNYHVAGENGDNTYAVCKPEYEFWSQR
ncbi:hypothetical protein MPER_06175, partial [Moniliophthora perniciosa FA553]